MTRATWSVLTQEEKSASGIAFRFAGVCRIRGITQFTWIFAVFNSRAMLSVKRLTPDLARRVKERFRFAEEGRLAGDVYDFSAFRFAHRWNDGPACEERGFQIQGYGAI